MSSRIINADCREAMREMAADSIDSIVCDPPYGLSFMGREWDHGVPGVPFWAEALRVLKPGAHLLAFGGTRTFHRLACAIEDAGFEIRDCLMWLYGSGFPKSLDVSKAIDKAVGAEREVVGQSNRHIGGKNWGPGLGAGDCIQTVLTAPATDAARQWAGWGTALKPAWEPIIVARKPLRGTVAANVQQFGTGALNIDGCRIGTTRAVPASHSSAASLVGATGISGSRPASELDPNIGRWPANVIHDGSDEVVALFPESDVPGRFPTNTGGIGTATGIYGKANGREQVERELDTGSAARFFYTSKASAADRSDGLYHRPARDGTVRADGGAQHTNGVQLARNHHPTVKPTDLMRYLCRLVTPPGGTVLDPFCGSGSTGKAALLEGFDFIGIELDPEYAAIADDRIYAAAPLFAGAAD